MAEPLLHQAFLAALPECIRVGGDWTCDGKPVRTVDSRVRLAWYFAEQACADHPDKRNRPGADWNAAIEAALAAIPGGDTCSPQAVADAIRALKVQ